MKMKVIKDEPESGNWIWFKAFEKNVLQSLCKAQDFLITWRSYLRSAEFWNFTWLWTSFLLKICSLRIRFAAGQGAKKKLMSWVSNRVPKHYVAKGFPDCFKDGILLCALTEKMVNGACPRFDLLDPDQPLRNLKLALYLVEKHIKIRPPVTADEILQNDKFSERRLLLLLAQMKMVSERFHLPAPAPRFQRKNFMSQTTFVSDKCFARGMGLLLAVRGRKSCFTILLESTENLDMVIEVRGPKNTACSKRITSALSLCRSDSADIRDIKDAHIQEDISSKKIPLTYRILGRKISVSYTPLESGTHNMSIIWQGQHIMGSPYTITVDSSIEMPDIWNMPLRRGCSRLKRSDSQNYDNSLDDINGTDQLASCSESAGTVARRKILRYIVRIDGNDVVIDGKEDLCAAIIAINRRLRNTASSCTEEESTTGFIPEGFSTKTGSEKSNEKFSSAVCTSFQEFSLGVPNDQSIAAEPHATDSSLLVNSKEPAVNHKQSTSGQCFLNTSRVDSLVRLSGEKLLANQQQGTNDSNFFTNSKGAKSPTSPSEGDATDSKDVDYNLPDKSENCDAKTEIKEIQDNAINSFEERREQDKSNSKSRKVLFCDERREEQLEDVKDSNFSNEVIDLNPDEDVQSNFFPVHKVEYEILHCDDDDDYDTEDCPSDFNPKRRKSFTELNEVNYLDEDVSELEEQIGNEVNQEGNANFGTYEDDKRSATYENESNNHDKGDSRRFLRSNLDLFQCDHSLSFWTETVTETPPEFERNETENVPKDDIDTSRNELNEAGDISETDREIIVKLGETRNLDNEESDCFEAKRCEFTNSDVHDKTFAERISLNNKREDDLDFIKNFLLRELPNNKKRSSWPEKEPLPAIRESSIEGILDLETHNDKLRNREIKEVTNLTFSNPSQVKRKLNTQYAALLSSVNGADSKLNESKFEQPGAHLTGLSIKPYQSSSKYITETVTQNSGKTEASGISLTNLMNEPCQLSQEQPAERIQTLERTAINSQTNGRLDLALGDKQKSSRSRSDAFSSMNILSASPYTNKNPNNKPGEIRFGTVALLKKTPVNDTLVNEPLYDSQNTPSDEYILTRATPILIDESHLILDRSEKELLEPHSENVPESTPQVEDIGGLLEQKSAQCLSVRKVIQIFQKEKEEPMDTWPSECSKSHKKIQNEDSDESADDKSHGGLGTSLFNSCVRTPRSSIRDKVKLFENDDAKKLPTIEKKNQVEKRASSTIRVKKDYWENITS